jgi:hypothetical protein
MDNELYSFALKSTLDEIRNLCPDIKNAFMFREDGEITAADESTPRKTIVKIVDSFDGLMEKAETMGGIELITVEGSKGGVNVSRMNSHYLVMVTSQNADKDYLNTMTHTLVKTVLKLLEKINPAPLNNNPSEPETEPEIRTIRKDEKPTERAEKLAAEESEQLIKPETVRPEPTANQFMVENIGGLLVAADTVRIDNETLLQWQELYKDGKIEEVEIETFEGKSTRCKIKPVKDSKQEGKGVVQIPQKIQRMLEVRKGELVKVKPVVE